MEINLEIWISAPTFLTDFDFVPLAKILEQTLKLHDLITKHLKLYCVLLPDLYLFLLVRTSSSPFISWDSCLCSWPHCGPGTHWLFLFLHQSKHLVKEQVSLRPRMAKGEASGNLVAVRIWSMKVTPCEIWGNTYRYVNEEDRRCILF